MEKITGACMFLSVYMQSQFKAKIYALTVCFLKKISLLLLPNPCIIMKRIIFFILLLMQMLVLCHTNCYAFFSHDIRLLTMQDGLADNKVNSIYKDTDGFMWFGTDNGLSRYDGTFVENFSMLSRNTKIGDINELSEHCLGIMVKDTLYGFNRLTERFISIKAPIEKKTLVQFIVTNRKECWLVTTDSLFRCTIHESENEKGQVTEIGLHIVQKIGIPIVDNSRIVRCCLSSDEREVYLATNKRLLIIVDKETGRMTRKVLLPLHHPAEINGILDYMNILWISTIADGIFRYHKHSGEVDHISYDGKKNRLSHTDVYDIIPINNGQLLATTWNGYTVLSPADENFERIKTEVYNNVSFINQNIEIRMICAHYDSQGILWIGTHGGGVMYMDLKSQYFNQLHQDRHNEIGDMTVDDDGYIWLATFHKGIMRSKAPFTPLEKLEFDTLKNEPPKETKTMRCLFKDTEGNIWFGNQNGTLTVWHKENGFHEYQLIVDDTINVFPIYALYIDRQKRFWIGTGNGMLIFDPVTAECRKLSVQDGSSLQKEVSVHAISETTDGVVWIGTKNNGVGKIMEDETIRWGYGASFGLLHASVRSLLASSDGMLYIGYETGLGIMNVQTEKMEHLYTTQNGLCNNFIGCLVEDSLGQIWIGSDSGISRYSRQQQLFYHYYISGSNRSAFLYGRILFWGNNTTLTYFDPQYINAFDFPSRIAVTSLEIGNKTVHIDEAINGQVILHNNLFHTDKIRLSHKNRDFSLTFSNLSYLKGGQKFRYRLYPYQEKWMIADRNEKVSYANLRTGEYRFEIQSLYPDEHVGKITSLTVVILPHWSETLLFKLLLLSLAILIVILLFRRMKLKQERLKRELQLEHEVFVANLERDKEKQVRMEREVFFTHAAHELRTPLTLILSPLQELLQTIQPSHPVYEKLLIMQHTGDELHVLIDQLLYVQKIEAGMVKLRLSNANMTELVKGVVDSFRPMAEVKKFNFVTEWPQEPLRLWMDVGKVTSAIQNLLSNAFKYTSPEGNVTLRMERVEIDEHWFCRLEVTDSGEGISEKQQERIFESFITGNNTPLFSTQIGVGLRIIKNTMDLHHGSITMKSIPKKGSMFVLLIPEGYAHFVEDGYEIIESCPEYELPILHEKEAVSDNTKPIKRLLVIEDHEEVRKYICSLFHKDYIVYEAINGEEGVQMALKHLPDLIISDIMMPIKDGFACCREIRATPAIAHIPILMLTAKAEDADVLHASRVGADDYMMKPFNPEILQSKVTGLILQRERLKRIYAKTLMLDQQEKTVDIDKRNEVQPDFIRQVIQVVEANISNEEFNVKILAEQLNMSQPTLYRRLKQCSKLAAIEIIRNVRMSKAASLIMENRYSMQEIAEKVGYSDTRTLRKHFMEQFGVSPSKYMSIKKE